MLDLSWSYLGPHIEPLPFKGRDCLPGQVARCLTGSCPLNFLILWILVIFVWHLQCFVLGVLQRSCPFRSVHEERRAMRSMGNDGGAPMVTIWVPCYHASFQKWHDQKQNEASMPRMPRMPRWEHMGACSKTSCIISPHGRLCQDLQGGIRFGDHICMSWECAVLTSVMICDSTQPRDLVRAIQHPGA